MARTHLPLRRTIPAGIAAYAVGYLLTLGVTISHSKTVTALEVSGRYLDATTLTQVFG